MTLAADADGSISKCLAGGDWRISCCWKSSSCQGLRVNGMEREWQQRHQLNGPCSACMDFAQLCAWRLNKFSNKWEHQDFARQHWCGIRCWQSRRWWMWPLRPDTCLNMRNANKFCVQSSLKCYKFAGKWCQQIIWSSSPVICDLSTRQSFQECEIQIIVSS